MIGAGFSLLNLIPFIDQNALGSLGGEGFNFTLLFCSAWMTTFAVILFAVICRSSLNKALARPAHERYLADPSFSPRTLAELFGSLVRNMMGDAMPKHEVKNFSGFIAGLFLYILFSNLQGIIPGLLPPTDNMNANIGIAIGSFLVFMFVGLSRDAAGFIKHLAGPIALLIPFFFTLEVLSLLLRPLTLGMRLTGNMFGDHLVFTIMSGLAPIGVPALLLGLATFVSFMQAFVFALLSSVYIGMSLPHEHHDDHGHEGAH